MRAFFFTDEGEEEYATNGWDFGDPGSPIVGPEDDSGGVAYPDPGTLCREVGGVWHIVTADFPKILFSNGEVDTRAHVVDAVLPLLPEEKVSDFLEDGALNKMFTSVVLVDDENIMQLGGITIEAPTMAIADGKLHFGNMIVHFEDVVEVAR